MAQAALITRFHNYLNNKYPNTIAGLSFPSLPVTDPSLIRIDFLPGIDPGVQANVRAETATYDFTQQDPNVAAFEVAINIDTTIGIVAKLELAKFFPLLKAHTLDLIAGTNMGIITGAWSEMIVAYGPSGTDGTWLTSAVQTTVLGYASTYNIPLV